MLFRSQLLSGFHITDDAAAVKFASRRAQRQDVDERQRFAEVICGFRDLEGCLFVFTEQKWIEFTEQLNSKGLSKKDVRSITRFFCSCAMNTDLDKQGRFVVNKNLREFAGIERDVMIIGVSDRIEIWSKEKWDEYSEAEYSDDAIMSERFDGLDF